MRLEWEPCRLDQGPRWLVSARDASFRSRIRSLACGADIGARGRRAGGRADGAGLDSRSRRLRQHRRGGGHCRQRRRGRDCAGGRGGDLQRTFERAVGRRTPSERRHLRVRLPLPEPCARLHRGLDVSVRKVLPRQPVRPWALPATRSRRWVWKTAACASPWPPPWCSR